MFHTYGIKAVTWPIAHASLVGLETQQQKLGPYTNGFFWGTHFTRYGTPHTLPPPNKLSVLFHKISLFFCRIGLGKGQESSSFATSGHNWASSCLFAPPPPAFLPLNFLCKMMSMGTHTQETPKIVSQVRNPNYGWGTMEWNECNILKQHEKYITLKSLNITTWCILKKIKNYGSKSKSERSL